jgi:hypothetical protein
MNVVTRISSVVLALGLIATPAAAQLLNDPVYVNPSMGTGLAIAGDVGYGINNASGKATSFNGRATLGLPMFQVTLGAGVMRPKGGGTSIANFMGQAAVKVLGSTPMMPVNVAIFAGAGYASKNGTKQTTIPAGVAIGLKFPSPGVSVEPWIAPRFNYAHVSTTGGSSSLKKFGVSGGINIDLPVGFGFQAAADYLAISGGSPFLISGGIHYKFSVPGLGMAGM